MRIQINWPAWGLAAIIVTMLAAFQPANPAERWLVGVFSGMPPEGFWELLNSIVREQWVYGILVMASVLVVYVLCPTREAAIPLAGLMGGLIIDWVLTPLVGRPRPLPGETGASFPSTAAIVWTVWFGSLIIVLWRRMRPGYLRRAGIGALVFIIALGGIAQLATGASWFTDVLGAWLWGSAWILWLHHATRQVG